MNKNQYFMRNILIATFYKNVQNLVDKALLICQ